MITRLMAFAIAAAWAASALAGESFTLEITPGGIPFYYLRRPDAERAILVGAFPDTFALRHPEAIAAPVVGASVIPNGPSGMTRGEFNEELKDYAGTCGLSYRPMFATLSLEARPGDFSPALDLCVRTSREPALRQDDLDRYRRAVAVNRAALPDNPAAFAGWLMRQLTEGPGAFARWDDPAEIDRIGRDAILRWRDEVFVRDNLDLVGVAPMESTSFARIIDGALGRLPSAAQPEVAYPRPVYPPRTIVLERPWAQSTILLEGPVELAPGEARAFLVANSVLGGGIDRRLSQAIRLELGATYGISSGISLTKFGPAAISIRSSMANELAVAGLKRVREVYDRWRREGVTENEVAITRATLANSMERSGEVASGKARTMLFLLTTGRTARDEANYVDEMRALGVDEVNRVLRARAPERLTTLVIAPSAEGFEADCVIHSADEIAKCR